MNITDFFDSLKTKGIDKIIDYDFNKVIAKTNGITLLKHTNNVWDISKILISSKKEVGFFEIEKNENFIIDDLSLSIFLHDIGKSFKRWQTHAKNNNLINVEFRHEFAFLPFYLSNKNVREKYHIISSVGAHHQNLTTKNDFRKINITDEHLNETYKKFKISKNIKEILLDASREKENFNKIIPYEEIINLWYNQSFYRHYLQLSDKLASTLENQNIEIPKTNKFNYKFPFEKLNSTQELIKNNSNELITFLRAPAGGGKTDAALQWANEQIKNKKCDKVIFALPTIFTSNALSNNVGSYIEGTVVSNSTSKYNKEKKDNKTEELWDFIWLKTFENHITIATIDQLVHSMTLSTEQHQSRLFNIVNSCVIIDESDFYDNFTQSNIFEFINLLYKLKVPVLIMSATIPRKTVDLLNKKLNTNFELVEDTSDYERDRVEIKDITDDYEQTIINNIHNDNLIIYSNTIGNAKKYYELCKKYRDDVILYHSQFPNKYKEKKEKEILDLLGKDMWKNNIPKGVIVMSQIGELSINISSNTIISDLCPMDRLIQRFGRCNRFNKECGSTYILVPKHHKYFFYTPLPYADKDFNESKYLTRTKEYLKKGKYNYNVYMKLIDEIYKDYEFDLKSQNNTRKLKEYFCSNWFFNGSVHNDDGEENNTIWKFRDIIEEREIVIKDDDYNNKFYGYERFNYFLYKNSLKIKKNDFKRMLKNGIIFEEEIIIEKGDDFDKEKVFVLDGKYFSYELGLKKWD
jgi:CRISPR-associated endonuclease/helicase Cas3